MDPDLVRRYSGKYRQVYQKSGKNRNLPAASRHERYRHPGEREEKTQ